MLEFKNVLEYNTPGNYHKIDGINMLDLRYQLRVSVEIMLHFKTHQKTGTIISNVSTSINHNMTNFTRYRTVFDTCPTHRTSGHYKALRLIEYRLYYIMIF